jgi:hypothetical protein
VISRRSGSVAVPATRAASLALGWHAISMSAAAARLHLRRLGVQRGRCGRWWARYRAACWWGSRKRTEARREGADTGQPEGGADLGGGPVGAAQQRRGALEATADPIRVRRLAVEVRAQHARGPSAIVGAQPSKYRASASSLAAAVGGQAAGHARGSIALWARENREMHRFGRCSLRWCRRVHE